MEELATASVILCLNRPNRPLPPSELLLTIEVFGVELSADANEACNMINRVIVEEFLFLY